ncbi:uncharacterized protein LOC106872430 [Octopus bimaculoides]|uniref:Uncharacterized protein n=1 Tax=Octopus bimaculoides TaxID=37653 RepID=A0A0L8H6W7_OCTBM|nr:uncharacterized protein LOC106872430 [Octopus bimaculoides]XP_014774916.1 uncharacterized protein LOC106872430 [Octopus bimaculoides]|eukprot:XP_014774915.1 PREDICTED: uncharacterized protein LOC106872430 [Octopus bimaculoides]
MYSEIRIWDKVGWRMKAFVVLAFLVYVCTPVSSMTLHDTTAIPSDEFITEKPMTKRTKSYTDNVGTGHSNDVNDIFKWIIVIFSVVLILLTISCALFRWLSNQETLFRSCGSEYTFFPPQRWKTMTPPPSYSELFPVQFTHPDANNGTALGRLSIQPAPQLPISSTVLVCNSDESSSSSAPVTTTTSTSTPVITNPSLTTWDQKTEKCSTTIFPAMKKDALSLSVENNALPSYEEALRMLSCESV